MFIRGGITYHRLHSTFAIMVQFKEFLKSFHNRAGTLESAVLNDYIDRYSTINTLFSAGPTAPYLFDMTTLNYPFISDSIKNILGVPAREFRSEGVKCIFDHMHPDDLSVMHNEVIPRLKRIRESKGKKAVKRLRFTFNYRFNHPARGYINCLEQGITLEADEKGNPLLHFGVITDISEFKRDHTMISTVSLLNQANEYETVHFHTNKPTTLNIFTAREMDVLRLLAKGFTSKEIGDKLYISNTTVDKHRRNILRKSSLKNTRQLVYFSLKQGWL